MFVRVADSAGRLCRPNIGFRPNRTSIWVINLHDSQALLRSKSVHNEMANLNFERVSTIDKRKAVDIFTIDLFIYNFSQIF